MARIQIDLPESFPFSTEIDLYLSHINYGNHLDNALLLTVVSEARLRYFKSMGYTELDIEGVGIVVADAGVQYRAEAFHGETMRVEMGAADFNPYGCDLVWRMSATARPPEGSAPSLGGEAGVSRSAASRPPNGLAVQSQTSVAVRPESRPVSDKASGREIARGKTGIVFFDYSARRKAPIPDGFRRRFPN